MHLYWRIIEELKFLNETWVMTDPSLLRCFEQWTRKNADVLALAEQENSLSNNGLFSYKGITQSLS
jgi:hypothetical protein